MESNGFRYQDKKIKYHIFVLQDQSLFFYEIIFYTMEERKFLMFHFCAVRPKLKCKGFNLYTCVYNGVCKGEMKIWISTPSV